MPSAVIERWECEYLRSYKGGWLLVYGRRKTGKTWLLRRCLDWSVYATVTRSGSCVLDREGRLKLVDLGECMDLIVDHLRRGRGTVVLDEFQRLPGEYWDLLASIHWESEGLLVACASSMGIVREVLSRNSPLLGLFSLFRVDIASVEDAVVSLSEQGLEPRTAVLWSVVARDPWILAHIKPAGDPWAVLSRESERLAPLARGLVGEVFSEEERSLTRTYEAVLHMLAEGVWRAQEIAARLYSLRLTSSPHPGAATGILGALESIGLVERVPLWRTRGARVYYRHRSSALSLLYRMLPLAESGEAVSLDVVRSAYGVETQFAIGELLAEAHRLRRGYSILAGGRDVDVVLLDKRGRALWGYEVKLGPIRIGEARVAVDTVRQAGIPRVGLVSLARRPPPVGDEALGPEDVVELSRRLARDRRIVP